MQRNIEEITSELIKLPKNDRLEIVRFLLFLDNRSNSSDDLEAAWDKEIMDRIRVVEDGTAKWVDYNEVKKKISNRYS